jgi:hypothetical protein
MPRSPTSSFRSFLGTTLGPLFGATVRSFLGTTLGPLFGATVRSFLGTTLGPLFSATVRSFLGTTLGPLLRALLGPLFRTTLSPLLRALLGPLFGATLGPLFRTTLRPLLRLSLRLCANFRTLLTLLVARPIHLRTRSRTLRSLTRSIGLLFLTSSIIVQVDVHDRCIGGKRLSTFQPRRRGREKSGKSQGL